MVSEQIVPTIIVKILHQNQTFTTQKHLTMISTTSHTLWHMMCTVVYWRYAINAKFFYTMKIVAIHFEKAQSKTIF